MLFGYASRPPLNIQPSPLKKYSQTTAKLISKSHLLKGKGLVTSCRGVPGVSREPANLATVRLRDGVLLKVLFFEGVMFMLSKFARAFSEISVLSFVGMFFM